MATIGRQLDDLISKAGEASRSLSELTGIRIGGVRARGGGLTTGDLRRMRGDIQGLTREVRQIGAGRQDPFLKDLFKSGPRTAV